jgi:predicted hydrolase (HD superfamily)
MAISYEQAVEKLNDWTESPALRNHALAVEAAMRRAAHRYGAGDADELRWAITSLLHDADYDQWPDEHPRLIVEWLTEQGEPEIAHAVAAHFTAWGVEPASALDKALLACDELTGFVMACCLVHPEGICSLHSFERQEKAQGQKLRGQGGSRGGLRRTRAAGHDSRRAHPTRDRGADTSC